MTVSIIRVSLRRQDDWMIATSEDMPGLFIASPDAEKVIDDVPDAIRILFKRLYR